MADSREADADAILAESPVATWLRILVDPDLQLVLTGMLKLSDSIANDAKLRGARAVKAKNPGMIEYAACELDVAGEIGRLVRREAALRQRAIEEADAADDAEGS